MKSRLLYFAVLLLPATISQAATFFEDFNSGTLNPNLSITRTTPNFGLNITGGEAVMTRTSGTGNEFFTLSTTFQGIGDFTVTVEADRTALGTGSFGVTVDDAVFPNQNALTIAHDVYFRPNGYIQGNVYASSIFTGPVISDGGSNTATFRLRRVGATVYDEVDLGNGFVTVNSRTDPNLTVPVFFGLFLAEEVGASDNLLGRFDNWSIQADQFINFVPEPSCLTLAAISMMVFLKRHRKN